MNNDNPQNHIKNNGNLSLNNIFQRQSTGSGNNFSLTNNHVMTVQSWINPPNQQANGNLFQPQQPNNNQNNRQQGGYANYNKNNNKGKKNEKI